MAEPLRAESTHRLLHAEMSDTDGNSVTVEWPVRDDQTDSHADAISVVSGLYDKLVGDSPPPLSVQITTTFMQRRA